MTHQAIAFALGAAVAALLSYAALRKRETRARLAERTSIEATRRGEMVDMANGLAHEIRNPLSTVALNAQLLREDILDAPLTEGDSARLVRRVDALAREAARLKDILEDFLRFAGRMQLDAQPTDLRELVAELADFFTPQAQASGVIIRVQSPDAPVMQDVDAALLKQAMLNLMINAVQALEQVPAASRELILRLEPSGTVHVIDTGPGVAADRVSEIFRPYISTKKGGTGLGLPVANRIVQEHGGRIVVYPAPGRGADFAIEWNADRASASSAGGIAAPRTRHPGTATHA
ncbi:MAG: HAMP domain-containing histidine kinase [Phycisphaerales bacterium]|nr:HAMP domain-containing histidine kinase [Phycisphaerales bacterium]